MLVKSTVTISEARATLPTLMKSLPKQKAVTITNHGRIAGFLISIDRMRAIVETMQILSDREAVKALRDYESGRSKGKDIGVLDE